MRIVLLFLLGGTAVADDWPGWRGRGGQGHGAEKDLPLSWSPTQNVKWKVALPDIGSSTPAVWGDKVFVTQATEKTLWPPEPKVSGGGPARAAKRSLLCYARADGTLLWRADVTYDEVEQTHPGNPFCSASPAVDGERIVVSHGSAGLYAYDFSGKELWKFDPGKMDHVWGNASSPVLHGDLVVLWAGPGPNPVLFGVDKKTGRKVWEHRETGAPPDKFDGSWSTPIVVPVNGTDQILLGVPRAFKGFDPKTGKELWKCDGLGNLVYASPLYADGIAVAQSGFGGPALAVKLGGSGDITKDRLWHHSRNAQRVGSGVLVGGHVYILEESGVPHCYELKTGKELWEAQMTTRPGGGGAWASMIHGAGRLYVPTRGGTVQVFAATPKFELLASNRLGEHTDASIAVSDGELFIRTYKNLWCIAEKK